MNIKTNKPDNKPIRMKRDIFLLMLFVICSFSLLAQNAVTKNDTRDASPNTYLNSIKAEMKKQWPENRTINLVFHGHSVPTGYFQTPEVKTLDAYPHLVLHQIKEQYPYAVINVITTSIGGEQAEEGAKRFKNEVLNHRPDVLFIDYALNDRGIGMQRSEKAWRSMIEAALSQHIKVLLFTPTPDMNENILDKNTPLSKHSRMIRKWAEDYQIGLIDSYQLFERLAEQGEDMKTYMSQSNHPNESGHQLVANEIVKYFKEIKSVPDAISGIYPRLAYYNNEGECGTGAVVPWADRLWVITYGPHLPYGSSDKLYEVTPDYRQIVREESTGGTPANRMVHQESNQLFIGPYAIDTTGNVRVIPYSIMPGRHTGNARHLTDPVGKIYYGTMEEGFYEVDVNTLDVKELYQDGNSKKNIKNDTNDVLPGVHGKGLYSGQGVLLFTNNGEGTQEALKKFDVEAGVLAEWDGKDWKVVRRNQFTEVTGPGDIYGNANPDTDPLWATGWDHKSILLGVRDAKKGWSFYRLPKASHSYDGAHGWNTEWPRIRNVGTASHPDYLMTMHGMFWRFPGQLTVDNSAGIRPRSAYLKVVGDFTRWNDQLVFGCDDSAQKEFLNKRKAKGNMEGPGQSNSNLWFTSFTKPDELGPATAEGAVWTQESVKANEASEPFLFAGWSNRIGWIKNQGKQPVTFSYEVDETGTNEWKTLKVVTLNPGKSASVLFSAEDRGEWIRLKADKATSATASFSYTTSDIRSLQPSAIYKGLASATETNMTGGLLYGLGDNRRALGLLANTVVDGNTTETGYYEMGDKLELVRKEDAQTANLIRSEFAIPQQAVSIENSSVLIVDDLGRRWRLPLGDEAYASLTNQGKLRVCREVATERDLFSCMGTFYELPAENADGYAKIRPVSTHNYHINDYASYRGMLILSGVKPEEGTENEHIIISNDGKAAIWAGVIDDLWQLGKPVGKGGPWKDTEVKAGVPSDPYLIGFYDKKELMLSHQSVGTITFTIEVDPTGNGDWMEYLVQQVKSGEKWIHEFPEEFQSRWIRCSVDTDTKATTWLEYK